MAERDRRDNGSSEHVLVPRSEIKIEHVEIENVTCYDPPPWLLDSCDHSTKSEQDEDEMEEEHNNHGSAGSLQSTAQQQTQLQAQLQPQLQPQLQEGRPVNIVRQVFVYFPEENRSVCKVAIKKKYNRIDACGAAITGKHVSNLRRHVRRWHKEVDAIMTEKEQLYGKNAVIPSQYVIQGLTPDPMPSMTDSPTSSNNDGAGPSKRIRESIPESEAITIGMTREKLEEACIELCIINNTSLSIIENSGFRKIIEPIVDALPEKTEITIARISKQIEKKAKLIRDGIKKMFRNKILALKLDCAMGIDTCYVSISVRQLLDDKPVSKCLGIFSFKYNHHSQYITQQLENTLGRYEISLDQIYTTCIDNAKDLLLFGLMEDDEMVTILGMKNKIVPKTQEDRKHSESICLSILNESINDIDLNYLDLSLGINALRCVEDAIQEAVFDTTKLLFSKDNPNENILKKVRILVEKLRSPNLSCLVIANNFKLPVLDSSGKWISVYNMILSVTQLREFCAEHARCHPELKISSAEWKEIGNITSSLEPAKKATALLKVFNYTIGEMYKIWLTCYLETTNLKLRVAIELAKFFKEHEPTIMTNSIFLAGLYMDPRFQLMLTDPQKEQATVHLLELAKRVEAMKEREVQAKLNDAIVKQEAEESDGKADVFDDAISIEDDFEYMLQEKEKELDSKPESSEEGPKLIEVKIRAYNKVPRLASNEDVIHYWSLKKDIPLLYNLATVVHNVPPYQESIRKMFYGLKFLVTTDHKLISTDTVDDAVVLRVDFLSRSQERSDTHC